MGKRRVKQQNISVIGLFKLAGRHKKMDDVFVNTRKHTFESLSQKRINKTKQNKLQTNAQTQSQTTFVTCLLLCLFVYVPFLYCLVVRLSVFFFSRVLISYTFYLVVVVHFNCIKRPVFKGPEFPCIQYKHCNGYLYQPATSLQPMAGFLCYFYLC